MACGSPYLRRPGRKIIMLSIITTTTSIIIMCLCYLLVFS